MKGMLSWLSVAFVKYVSASGRIVFFDPWTRTEGNDLCPFFSEDFESADLILISHDHYDHIASASSLSKKTGAIIGGPDESMKRLIKEEGILPSRIVNSGSGYITGGGADLGWIKIIAAPAIHTSRTSIAMGTIIQIDDTTIYHAGDTSITAEMEIFARLYPIDVAILPIFGIAAMDYIQAAEAVRLIKPKVVMPIHFDFVCKNPEEILTNFLKRCKVINPEVHVLKTELNFQYDLSGY